MLDHWIADRALAHRSVRHPQDLRAGQGLKDPVNLSIGQPHFDVPEPIKAAAKAAIDRGDNGYTVTQGIPELARSCRPKLTAASRARIAKSLVTSGTSGALMLALCATVNPGDEVILFDPYFVAYPHLVTLAGGTAVVMDTYPDFRDRRGPRPRRDHAADQGDPLFQPVQPDRDDHRRRRRFATWPTWPARRTSCSSPTRSTGRSGTTGRSDRPRSSTRTSWSSTGSASPTGSPAGGSASPTARSG